MMLASSKPGRIVCFGEVLLRLSSPAGELLLQSPVLNTCIGGAEANVAVSLARLGHDVAMVSALPDNALGMAARDGLRAHGVDTRGIGFRAGRMGLYFLTPGAVMRQSDIIYDRAGSVFAQAEPELYDWPSLLAGADWLHVSGVSPAVGRTAGRAVLAAMRAARSLGVQVAFDANYRASLWASRGVDGAEVLHELMSHADIAFADRRDIALVLGRPELANEDRHDDALGAAFESFPQLARLAATTRTQHSIERHDLAARLHTREGSIETATIALRGIVDRIGTGDAFAAGVLHGLQNGWTDINALEFGLAAASFKHGVAGDFSPASEAQIQAVRQGALDVRR